MLGGAVWSESSARRFEAGAVRASGTVIDLARRRSNDDSSRVSDDYTYAPVVEWRDANGARQELVGRVSSNPPAYERGETVAVLYPAGKPGQARIADFTNRYFMPLLLGGLGTIFSLVGGALAFFYVRKRRRIEQGKATGVPITAKFLETWLDTTLTVNGRHPYRVAAQATLPTTGKLRRFDSEPIWVDPSEAIAGKPIRVLVDPADPAS
jgi:hypothetical protein